MRAWWVLLSCLLIVGAGGASASVGTAAAQGTNASPEAQDNAYRVKSGDVRRVPAPGVLNNDVDPDGDELSATKVSGPGHGKLDLRSGGSFVYTPDKGYRGKDSFDYRAADGNGGFDTATVKIIVWKEDRPPLARNNVYRIEEDGTLTVPARGVLNNDSEADGRRLFATKVTDPGHGSLSLDRDGSFVYTPDRDFNGEDSFIYRARDGRGRADEGNVRIAVDAVNDAPVFTGASGNTSQTIDEGSGLTALEATDVDGDTLTFELTSGQLPPGITLRDDGGFTGAAGSRAADDYTANIEVSDGNGETATTELAVTVNQVEEAAVAEDVDVTTDEDVAETITLSATDADSDSLTFAIASSPGHGTLGSVSAPDCSTPAGGTTACTATVVYTPEADYNGPDSFTYKANDGNADSEPATVTITVNPVNDAPTVAFDNPPSSADEGETKTLAFTVADPDAGDSFTVNEDFPDCGTGGVQAGQTSTNASGGSFECSFPDGPASTNVRMQVTDAQDADSNVAGQSVAVANVKPSISLSGPNEANEGETKTYDFTVTDPGDDTHTITTACGDEGDKVQDSDQYDQQTKTGSFRCFFPDGPETTNVTATATDSDGAVDTDNRRVEVTLDNVAPTAQDLSETTDEDTEKAIMLAATDPAGANDPITFGIVSLPANGTLYEGASSGGNEIANPGAISGSQVTYDPDADHNGSDSFTYKANDGDADSNTATATITINAVNDAPVNTVPQGSLSTGEGEDLNITGISVDDVDAGNSDIQTTLSVDGGTLTVDVGVQNGATVADNGTGSVTLTGTVAQINATLGAGATYNSAGGGSFTLTVETDDQGNTGSGGAKTDTDTVAIVVDAAPTVTTTTPASDATDVAVGGDITVNFSEPVNAGASSFELKCPATGSARSLAVTGSGSNSVTLNPDSDLPGATECQVRVISGQVSDTDTNDPPDNMAADHTFIFTTAPRAIADDYKDTFTVAGNVRFDSAQRSPLLSVLDNDEKNGSTTVTASDTTSAQGGNATVRPNGTFEYNPPAGYEGLDTFTYTVNGGSTATVTLRVGGMIWFVDEDATTSGDGRLSSPFDTLSAFNALNNGNGNNPAANDNVYLYESDANYTGGVTLLSGQRLIGQDTSQPLSEIVGFNRPSGSPDFPTRNSTNATKSIITNGSGVGVTLGAGNTIRGLTVQNTSGSGIKGTNVNNATMGSDVAVSGTNGGAAVDVSGGNGTVSHAGTISNTSGRPVSVTGRTGGSVTFGGDIGSTGSGILAENNTGGTITFSGATKTLNTGANPAVTLGTNAGATINFTNGNLDIDTTSGNGFTAGGGTLNVSGSNNTINSTGATALNLSGVTSGTPGGVTFAGVSSGGGVDNVSLSSISGGDVALNGGALSGASQRAFNVSGGGANVTYNGTISNSNQGIRVADKTGGAVTFSGTTKTLNTVGNPAVTLDNNDSGTVRFTNGGLDIDTTSGAGFNATNGATAIEVTGSNNTISSGTGTALNVSGSSIGSNGLTFRSISANGGANGIVLNNTGSSGSLSVTGGGNTAQGGDNSGGTIQSTTGHGLSLMNTTSPSFRNMRLLNTGNSGVNGTQVSGFSFTDGTITGAGDASDENSITFDDSLTTANLSGVVTITNNVISQTEAEGVDIHNFAGTISNANISTNALSDTGDVATPGSAISLLAGGQPSAAANITRATVSNNTITDFRAGVGVQVRGGNVNAGGPAGNAGIAGSATDVIAITGNLMNGGSGGIGNQPDRFFTGGVSGIGQGNFNVSSNGTAANRIRNIDCIAIELQADGPATMTSTVQNNFINANSAVGCAGIAVGTDDPSNLGAGTHTTTISDNDVMGTDGPGIFPIVRDSGSTMTAKVLNNTVAAPITTNSPRAGIRVDSGSAEGDTTLCLEISGNTTAGSTNTGTGTTSPGINLRKQGTDPNVNTFGIEGMAATASPGVENYVNGLNTSTSGTFGTGGTALLSATSGFTNCNAP